MQKFPALFLYETHLYFDSIDTQKLGDFKKQTTPSEVAYWASEGVVLRKSGKLCNNKYY